MTRRIILHVGHAKTGSTSIQKTLMAQRQQLLKAGILYPKLQWIKHKQGALVPDLVGAENAARSTRFRMGDDHLDDPHTVAANSEAAWKSVCDQVEAVSPHTVILSCESFFRVLNPEAADRLQARIEALGGTEVRALGYVRSPAKRYLSQVQQRLKWSRSIYQPKAYSYISPIESYKRALGTQIDIRMFDRKSLKGGDVVQDFLHWAGISDLIPDLKAENHNVSMSTEAMSILNRNGPPKRPSSKAQKYKRASFLKALRAVDDAVPQGTRPSLRPDVARTISKLNHELIPLRETFGITFPDVDYDDLTDAEVRSAKQLISVEDLCELNIDRRNILERKLRSPLSGLGRRMSAAMRARG